MIIYYIYKYDTHGIDTINVSYFVSKKDADKELKKLEKKSPSLPKNWEYAISTANVKEDTLFDPKNIGVPNICFSLTDRNDDREKKFSKQRIRRGFDDSETWCLASTIAKFIIPRLGRFIEIEKSIHDDGGETEDYEKMLKAFELILKDDASWNFTEEDQKELSEGLELFGLNYLSLWW